jgi:HAD superfamily hydrolase (TIGR01509 family)
MSLEAALMHEARPDGVVLHRQELDAVIFDMDGVVTRTATLHAKAWKQTFDEFLRARPGAKISFQQFDIEADYGRYVDGKPRYDGVVSYLTSRGISLPYGSRDDPPESETICGVGNRKDLFFQRLLASRGVEVFESTIELIRRLRAAGLKTGIFSASRHAEQVLSAANALSLFDAKVDGVDADRLGLEGKPHPATLIELAGRLGAVPARTAVVEDAVAGVQAARAGGFSLVIGVNRTARQGILLENGADVEVTDLREVQLADT